MLDGDRCRADGRNGSRRVAPANELSEDERQQILAIANRPEFVNSLSGPILPTLAVGWGQRSLFR
jgi:hypothetical protein